MEYVAELFSHILVDRAGMGLSADSQLLELVEDGAGLYF
jgi:hypothetical protein